MAVTLAPGESKCITRTVQWLDYEPWFPEHPRLYHLETSW